MAGTAARAAASMWEVVTLSTSRKAEGGKSYSSSLPGCAKRRIFLRNDETDTAGGGAGIGRCRCPGARLKREELGAKLRMCYRMSCLAHISTNLTKKLCRVLGSHALFPHSLPSDVGHVFDGGSLT